MKDLKFTLQKWFTNRGHIKGSEITLDFYRTSYGDEIPKKELEANLVSLETWAAYAYKKGLLFHVTAFLASNEQPYADIF